MKTLNYERKTQEVSSMSKKMVAVMLSVMFVLALGMRVYAADIVLKVGDNIPDRTQGWGAVIEEIYKEFLKTHPGVKIETESYPDQPYQDKMKIYATSRQLPDIFKYWSFSTLLKPLVDEKLVVELKKADFEGKNFIPGALESNIWNDKLYGIPVSGDLWVIYYNKALFDKYGVKVPTTIGELFAAGEVFKKNGLIPISSDGKDSWPFCLLFDNLAVRYTGDVKYPSKAIKREVHFTDAPFVKAATLEQKMAKELFQADVVTSDYGAARNLFGQEAAAMYMMGSWELGLANDTNFSEEFRKNVRAFKIPVIEGEKGTVDEVMAWFGGNYVVNSQSKHPELAMDLLKLIAERMGGLLWERQAAFPAQMVKASEKDTQLAKDLLKVAADAKATSGTGSLDLSTPAFKEDCQKFVQELVAGLVTPEEFCKKLEAAAETASKQ
jgi:raffinose/stachyose/melibiose transport system substrate-binding protein